MKVYLLLLASLFVIAECNTKRPRLCIYREGGSCRFYRGDLRTLRMTILMAQWAVARHEYRLKRKSGTLDDDDEYPDQPPYGNYGPLPPIPTPSTPKTDAPVTKSANWHAARDKWFRLTFEALDDHWYNFLDDGQPTTEPPPERRLEHEAKVAAYNDRAGERWDDIEAARKTICDGSEHSCVMPVPWVGSGVTTTTKVGNPWPKKNDRGIRSLSIPENRAKAPNGCKCQDSDEVTSFYLEFNKTDVVALMNEVFLSGLDIIDSLVEPDPAILLSGGTDELVKAKRDTCFRSSTKRVRLVTPQDDKSVLLDLAFAVKAEPDEERIYFRICECKRHSSGKDCGQKVLDYLSVDAVVNLFA